ncbi:MAG: hypothetical protein ACE5F5_04695 [Acidimicrobiia bacterium]
MCRLYGFLGTEPTRLECSLVDAQCALLIQSDRGLWGVRNPDGTIFGVDASVRTSTRSLIGRGPVGG